MDLLRPDAWPASAEALAVLTFQAGFNTAVVVAGTTLLGVAAGLVGSFALLRKRALVSDALSHATLPGLALAFLAAVALGMEGRSVPVLLAGAVVTGSLGVVLIQLLVHHTRLPEDAAIGIVLSGMFGLGVVLLSYIQGLQTGNQAGLETYILGQPAAMNRGESLVIAAVALGAAAAVALLFKEFRLLCFDPAFAAAQGWPVFRLDLAMMALVVVVTVIGLTTVGLILIVALVIVPAAAARFWTERLAPMVAIAALIGGLSGYFGAAASALLPRMPAGAVIVLVAGLFFLLSLMLAPARGVLAAALRRARLRGALAERRALRALAEADTAGRPGAAAAAGPGLLPRWLVWRLRARGLLAADGGLTADGRRVALEAARNEALWERFMSRYPELAPSGVAYGIDRIEDVLPADLVAELRAGGTGIAAPA